MEGTARFGGSGSGETEAQTSLAPSTHIKALLLRSARAHPAPASTFSLWDPQTSLPSGRKADRGPPRGGWSYGLSSNSSLLTTVLWVTGWGPAVRHSGLLSSLSPRRGRGRSRFQGPVGASWFSVSDLGRDQPGPDLARAGRMRVRWPRSGPVHLASITLSHAVS